MGTSRGDLVLAQGPGQARGFDTAMEEIAEDPVAFGPAILAAQVVVPAQGRLVGEL
jgi:hypothetical protein